MRISRASGIEALIVIVLFAVLAIGFTMPVAQHLKTSVPGTSLGAYQDAGEILRTENHWRELDLTDSIREIVTHVRVDSVALAAYSNLVFSFPAGQNIFWLLSFFLAGIGAYCLMRTVLREQTPDSRIAPFIAFFSGIAFTFAPYHLAVSAGTINAAHIEWLPWAVFVFIQLLQRPTVWRFLWLCVFGALIAKSGQSSYAYFLLLLVLISVVYRARIARLIRQPRLRWYAAGFVILAVGIFFLRYSPTQSTSLIGSSTDTAIQQAIEGSSDALSFIVPPSSQTLWGQVFNGARASLNDASASYPGYIGIIVLFLTVLALFLKRPEKRTAWAFIAFGFFILSLGPILHLAGTVEPKIPLPYLLIFQFIPYFDRIPEVSQLTPVAHLSFALASGFGLFYLVENRIRSFRWQRVISVLLCAGVAVEFFAVPFPTTRLSHSRFYDLIRSEPGDFHILEIPSATNALASAKAQFYQHVHQKAIVGPDWAKPNLSQSNDARTQFTNPILYELLLKLPNDAASFNHQAINTTDQNFTTAMLADQDIRYIVLSKQFIGDGQGEVTATNFFRIQTYIENNLRARTVYEDDELLAFRVGAPAELNIPLLEYGTGWGGAFTNQTRAFQWIEPEATLRLKVTNPLQETFLRFGAMSLNRPTRSFRITINNSSLGEFLVTDTYQPFEIRLANLQSGWNEVSIKVIPKNTETVEGSLKKKIAFSDILATQEAKRPLSTEAYFGAQLSDSILELPYSPTSKLLNDEQARLIAPQTFITDYLTDIGFIAATHLTLFTDLFFAESYTPQRLTKIQDIRTTAQYSSELQSVISKFGIRHIALNTDRLSPNEVDSIVTLFKRAVSIEEQPRTDHYRIFNVGQTTDFQSPFIIPDNFSKRAFQKTKPKITREMTSSSSLLVANPSPELVSGTLHFWFQTCSSDLKTLRIVRDQEVVALIPRKSAKFRAATVPVTLQPGDNVFALDVLDKKSNALDNTQLKLCPVKVGDFSFDTTAQ